jgi:hypothetical protein
MRPTSLAEKSRKTGGKPRDRSATALTLATLGALAGLPACSSSDAADADTGTAATGGGSGASGAQPGAGGASNAGAGGNAGLGAAGGASAGSSGMFSIEVEMSPEIQTVGIVSWSITTAIDSAYIDFGRDQNALEYRASVDLGAPGYRTLLLGMKPATQYYARITAKSGPSTFMSQPVPLMTGFLPNGLPVLEVADGDASGLWADGGFTVQCTGLTSGPGFGGGNDEPEASHAFIFDKDGDQVWAYELTDTVAASCSRARLSIDGKYLWAGNFNNADTNGAVLRISLDGLETKSISIRARNHDFAFLPNGHLLYWEQANGGGYTDGKEGPDIIREMDPDTELVTDIYDQMTDFSEQINDSQGSHTNQINYVPELDAISFSMRHTSTVGLISYPGGELLTVFGGPITSYSSMDWDFQHGHHVRGNQLFVFNNNGSNGGSSVLGFQFDMASSTASPNLDYSSGRSSGAFGDVKELENGNLYVTYSTSGVIHEINAAGTLLREITTDASLGYSEHRASLYGPPPPFDEP